jgi:hypothetical protein
VTNNPTFNLESVLQQLIVEHRKLSRHVDAYQLAMRSMQLDAMDQAAMLQEGSRLRMGALVAQRRAAVSQLVRQHRLPADVTMSRLADAFPNRRATLLTLRDELKNTIHQVQLRANVAGRLAGAVLGHLNTVVRLIAGAVERAGVYTKHGVPQVSQRIGVMEAVG